MFIWPKDDLNDEQEAAIREPGSVFLVACPGSGKTHTLTYKIADELSKIAERKKRVVAITYTHRAADEIHDRVELLGVDTSKLWIGTIHSFCLEWILKPYSIYHNDLKDGFRVIDQHDSDRLLTDICRGTNNPRVSRFECEYFHTPSGRSLSPRSANKHVAINSVLDQYYASLRQNRQIDFELILKFAYELIVSHPPICVLLSSIFSCLLVDEYQDTKEIQYAIVAAILKAGKGTVRTFIVGDPNQAIYGSLGGFAIEPADFKAMAEMELTELNLSKNYRSSEKIINYFGNYNGHGAAVVAAAEHKDYIGIISYDATTTSDDLEAQLVKLIRHNIEDVGIEPHELCILAPWWIHLASMTRKLVAALPEYSFDGPGLVPFARDIDNFWYKLSKILLTEPSPGMYVRRYRWAGEILSSLSDAGVDVTALSRKSLLRQCNSITCNRVDGLEYLSECFDALFNVNGINFKSVPMLAEHHDAFFTSSRERLARLQSDGVDFSDIATFRKVFGNRSGITVSTIHGVKGTEYDAVIAYALLEGMVPHFSDPNGDDSARRLLYVVSSRARKNLHLIAETGRIDGRGYEYVATSVLGACVFSYDPSP